MTIDNRTALEGIWDYLSQNRTAIDRAHGPNPLAMTYSPTEGVSIRGSSREATDLLEGHVGQTKKNELTIYTSVAKILGYSRDQVGDLLAEAVEI